MAYLTEKDGGRVPFRTAADRKNLIGKDIVYLRSCDIDRSGRGYFFPQWGRVEACKGREIFLDGTSVMASDLVEVVVRTAAKEG